MILQAATAVVCRLVKPRVKPLSERAQSQHFVGASNGETPDPSSVDGGAALCAIGAKQL